MIVQFGFIEYRFLDSQGFISEHELREQCTLIPKFEIISILTTLTLDWCTNFINYGIVPLKSLWASTKLWFVSVSVQQVEIRSLAQLWFDPNFRFGRQIYSKHRRFYVTQILTAQIADFQKYYYYSEINLFIFYQRNI